MRLKVIKYKFYWLNMRVTDAALFNAQFLQQIFYL